MEQNSPSSFWNPPNRQEQKQLSMVIDRKLRRILLKMVLKMLINPRELKRSDSSYISQQTLSTGVTQIVSIQKLRGKPDQNGSK